MDYDYHDSFKRLVEAYRLAEKGICTSVLQSADTFVEQAKALNFETDLNYFLNEYSQSYHPPSEFQFMQFDGNDVSVCGCGHGVWMWAWCVYYCVVPIFEDYCLGGGSTICYLLYGMCTHMTCFQ